MTEPYEIWVGDDWPREAIERVLDHTVEFPLLPKDNEETVDENEPETVSVKDDSGDTLIEDGDVETHDVEIPRDESTVSTNEPLDQPEPGEPYVGSEDDTDTTASESVPYIPDEEADDPDRSTPNAVASMSVDRSGDEDTDQKEASEPPTRPEDVEPRSMPFLGDFGVDVDAEYVLIRLLTPSGSEVEFRMFPQQAIRLGSRLEDGGNEAVEELKKPGRQTDYRSGDHGMHVSENGHYTCTDCDRPLEPTMIRNRENSRMNIWECPDCRTRYAVN